MRIGDADEFQRFTDDWVFDVLDGLNALEFRILDDDVPLKRPVLRDVDVFVDRRGDEEAAVFTIIGRQVGATAAEGNAQRGSGDDHRWKFGKPEETK
jgi:hypothetical protein